jgi:hypothetical protein
MARGVTDWRKVVVLMTHRIGPAPNSKETEPRQQGRRPRDRQREDDGAAESAQRADRDHRAEGEPRDDRRGEQRADDHAGAGHGQAQSDAGGRQAEMVHGIGSKDRQHHEIGRVVDELNREDRCEQSMPEHERSTLANLVEHMPPRRQRARRLVEPAQECDGGERQECRRREGGGAAAPADDGAAQRRPRGEGEGAGQLDARVGAGQQGGRHEGGDQRRRRDAEHHSSAHRDEAEQRQDRPGEQAERGEGDDGEQGSGAHGFGADHQPAPRQAVRHQARGNREDDERQSQDGLQQSGLAGAGAKRQHRDDGRRGQCYLLGGLCREVGPRQACEAAGQARRVIGHGRIPGMQGFARG